MRIKKWGKLACFSMPLSRGRARRWLGSRVQLAVSPLQLELELPSLAADRLEPVFDVLHPLQVPDGPPVLGQQLVELRVELCVEFTGVLCVSQSVRRLEGRRCSMSKQKGERFAYLRSLHVECEQRVLHLREAALPLQGHGLLRGKRRQPACNGGPHTHINV